MLRGVERGGGRVQRAGKGGADAGWMGTRGVRTQTRIRKPRNPERDETDPPETYER